MSLCVEVTEYCCVGDESYYTNHTFGVRIWSEQEHLHYSVQRNYLSFCSLHARLTKKFTRTSFPSFPLEGYNNYLKKVGNTSKSTATKYIMKQFQKSSIENSNDPSSVSSASSASSKSNKDLRNSITSDTTCNFIGGIKITNKGEVITHKKVALTNYLRQLLTLPEIIICEDLKVFFDEEAPDGSSIQRRALTDIEAALIGEEANIVTVSREHKVTLSGQPNDVVVWSFATKKRDIGFSVHTVDSQKTGLPYQRYDSHVQTISGCFELVDGGKVELLWDNLYAKFHSKVLTYMCKVLNKSEFAVCQRIAYEKGRDRHRFEQQRVVLRRVLSVALKEVQSAQGGGGLLKTSSSRNSETEFSTLEESMVHLREELLSIQAQLTERETMLVDERSNLSNLAERFQEEESLRKNLESDLQIAQQRVEELQSCVESHKRERDLSTAESDRFKILLEHSTKKLKIIEADLKNKTQNLIDITNQLSKIKSEKKQLKAYALKLKAENESSLVLNTTATTCHERCGFENDIKERRQEQAQEDDDHKILDPNASENPLKKEEKSQLKVHGMEESRDDSGEDTSEFDDHYHVDPSTTDAISQSNDEADIGSELRQDQNCKEIVDIKDHSNLLPENEQDALCAQILNAEYGQRLLYLHNSIGF